MKEFKVICKIANKKCWEYMPRKSKTVSTSYLFGLITKTKVVPDLDSPHGPGKDEVCIVYETYMNKGELYYKLVGYPYGGYHSIYFIRLDELQEVISIKEIEKQKQLN